MKIRANTIHLLAILLTVTYLQDAVAAPRSSSRNRRSHGPALKSGDKAPDFSLLLLPESGNAVPKTNVTLSDTIKDRPASLVFSSFT